MVGLVQLLLQSHAASSLVEDYASCLEIRSQENQNMDNSSDDLGVLILQALRALFVRCFLLLFLHNA